MLDWNRISWKFNGSKSWLLPQLAEDHWNDTSMVSFLYVPGIVAHFFSYPVRMSLFNAHENHVDTLDEAMQQHILAQLLPEGKNNSYVYFPSNQSSPITITDISLHSVFRDAHASWSSPFPLQTWNLVFGEYKSGDDLQHNQFVFNTFNNNQLKTCSWDNCLKFLRFYTLQKKPWLVK
jgi:hypothetical protein